MKKRYEKPRINVEDIASCAPLSTSGFYTDTDSKGDFDDDFVKGRREVWGNLWDKANDASTRE